MKDYQTQLEKLRRDAADCKLISDLATDKQKRALFDRLLEALRTKLSKKCFTGVTGPVERLKNSRNLWLLLALQVP